MSSSSDPELSPAILRMLAKHPLLSAPQLVTKLRTVFPDLTTSDVNSCLYTMVRSGLVSRDESTRPRWSVCESRPANSVASAPRTGSAVSIPSEPDDSKERRSIIEAPADARLLIDACPGAGKTHVACARAGHLIVEHRVAPTNIHFVSFTRTAVAELRTRIAKSVGDETRARAISISTLDSTIWHFMRGFSEEGDAASFCGYEENIERACELLKERRPEVCDHLESLEHLLVDEAQDLVGVRAHLVLQLLRNLNPSCGVTVFADPAQSIYGFTSDESEGTGNADAFLDMVAQQHLRPFERRSLTHVWRTSSPKLLDIVRSTRHLLATVGQEGGATLEDVKRSVCDRAHAKRAKLDHRDLQPGALVLYRRRVDAIVESSYLSEKGVDHRLRMSGLPILVHPWIGWLLSSAPRDRLDRHEFKELWKTRSAEAPSLFAISLLAHDSGFDLLLRFAQDGESETLSLKRLRDVLSRPRPPIELCLPDCGANGPIVGTIHASKGREARRVILELPLGVSTNREDDAAESRVVYVGATRAMEELFVVAREHPLPSASNLESGRVYHWTNARGRFQMEIGREGDVDPIAHARRSTGTSERDARRTQEWLARSAGSTRELCAFASEESGTYTLRLAEPDADQPASVGVLSPRVGHDIMRVANLRWTPDYVKYIYLIGVRTIALAPGDSALEDLHAPYARTGFVLAPVVKAFAPINCPKRG